MALTITWGIDTISTLQEPHPNYVVEVAWSAYGQDGDYGAGVGDRTTLATTNDDAFVPYENLTEAVVIGWLQATLGTDGTAAVEAKIQEVITAQMNPPTVVPQNTPLPWAQE